MDLSSLQGENPDLTTLIKPFVLFLDDSRRDAALAKGQLSHISFLATVCFEPGLVYSHHAPPPK